MLKDRGYIISEKRFAQTKQEFADFYASGPRDKLNTLVTKRKSGDDITDEAGETKMFVFFHDQDKLNEAAVKQIAHTMLTNKVFNSIVIVKGTTQVGRKVRNKMPLNFKLGTRRAQALRN